MDADRDGRGRTWVAAEPLVGAEGTARAVGAALGDASGFAISVDADLIFIASSVAATAVERIPVGVGADVVVARVVRTLASCADPVDAGFVVGAGGPASSAVGAGVEAVAGPVVVAVGGSEPTFTHTVCAVLGVAAVGLAGAAVAGVVGEVDAVVVEATGIVTADGATADP